MIREIGIYNSLGNPKYTPTIHTNEKITDKHRAISPGLLKRSTKSNLVAPILSAVKTELQSKCDTSDHSVGQSDMDTEKLEIYVIYVFFY